MVGHHDFQIAPSSVSIIPPQAIVSICNLSSDFHANLLLFTTDFVKKGFLKNEAIDELLFINPDYAPTFELEEVFQKGLKYKFVKIHEELSNENPFAIEVSRLYILQLLYDYNRICERCLLNSDKMINRQYQVMYHFRKLVDRYFCECRTVQEYAKMMNLTPKYISECVKNQAGVSALSVIHKRIVLEAEHLLHYSKLSIKEISLQLGFLSTSTFSRFFKTLKGCSPQEFQRQPKN